MNFPPLDNGFPFIHYEWEKSDLSGSIDGIARIKGSEMLLSFGYGISSVKLQLTEEAVASNIKQQLEQGPLRLVSIHFPDYLFSGRDIDDSGGMQIVATFGESLEKLSGVVLAASDANDSAIVRLSEKCGVAIVFRRNKFIVSEIEWVDAGGEFGWLDVEGGFELDLCHIITYPEGIFDGMLFFDQGKLQIVAESLLRPMELVTSFTEEEIFDLIWDEEVGVFALYCSNRFDLSDQFSAMRGQLQLIGCSARSDLIVFLAEAGAEAVLHDQEGFNYKIFVDSESTFCSEQREMDEAS